MLLYGLLREISVVPFNKNYTSPVEDGPQIVKMLERGNKVQSPTIDQQTGLCVVCGMARNTGHGWPCIVYLMKLAVSSYDKKMKLCEMLLNRILLDRHVKAEEVSHVLAEIQAARDLIHNVGDGQDADKAAESQAIT